ncbi:MAG: hypothetical protein KDE33_08280, partial [Bacteroidetes bacterium]|nr:hypothetical protein [Bacteroidota bacterium]
FNMIYFIVFYISHHDALIPPVGFARSEQQASQIMKQRLHPNLYFVCHEHTPNWGLGCKSSCG